MRAVHAALLFLLFCGSAHAHGGVFRPPPKVPPRDPVHPGGELSPTTRSRGGETGAPPWRDWWDYHAEELLRIRERIAARRTVTKGGAPAPEPRASRRERVREKGVVPLLLQALSDDAAEVRVAAALGLGKLGAKGARVPLRERLDSDPDPDVRDAALVGLMLLRDERLTERFRGVVRDEDADRRTRGLAAIALGPVRDTVFLGLVLRRPGEARVRGTAAALDELRADAAFALGLTARPAAAALLVEAVRDEQAPRATRGFAAAALGRVGGPAVLPDVLRLLRDEDAVAEARHGAAIAAGRLVRRDDPAAIDILGDRARRDPNGGLRALAVMSLGRIGGPRAAEFLLDELDTNEQTIRGFLLLALAQTGEERAGARLHAQLRRLKHPGDRGACALALGLAGHREAAVDLRRLAKGGNAVEQGWALLALGLVGDTGAAPLVREALLRSKRPGVVRRAARALVLLRGAGAADDLLRRLKRAQSTYLRAAVHELFALYNDEDAAGVDRALAAGAMARIASPHAVSPLAKIAEDFNPYAVSDAVRLLVTLG